MLLIPCFGTGGLPLRPGQLPPTLVCACLGDGRVGSREAHLGQIALHRLLNNDR